MSFLFDFIIVGSGITGSVIANILSEKKYKCLIVEKNDHVAGNCYDYIDEKTGILVNKYGAKIFHTDYEIVWEYINKFCNWKRYDHYVLVDIDNELYNLPININTYNKLYNENISTEKELDELLKKISSDKNLFTSIFGERVYHSFFEGYTIKQWDKDPEKLDPEIIKRIPLRKNFDNRYFTDKYQCLPEKGYTFFIEKLLDKSELIMNTSFEEFMSNEKYKNYYNKDHTTLFYTGPIDEYYKFIYSKLEYRSLRFEKEYHDSYYYQKNSIINYPNIEIPYTRIIEYKHFYEKCTQMKTVIFKEFPSSIGERYYPLLDEQNKNLYKKYEEHSKNDASLFFKKIIFCGRLGGFKYLDMDDAIYEAINIASYFPINSHL